MASIFVWIGFLVFALDNSLGVGDGLELNLRGPSGTIVSTVVSSTVVTSAVESSTVASTIVSTVVAVSVRGGKNVVSEDSGSSGDGPNFRDSLDLNSLDGDLRGGDGVGAVGGIGGSDGDWLGDGNRGGNRGVDRGGNWGGDMDGNVNGDLPHGDLRDDLRKG
jgi:hypothetical protein